MSITPDSQLTGDGVADLSALEITRKEPRNCVVNPLYEPLTEDTLPKLEQSQPRYRTAQRNLEIGSFIESTIQDSLDTFLDRTDRNFYPSSFEPPASTALPFGQNLQGYWPISRQIRPQIANVHRHRLRCYRHNILALIRNH